MSKEVDLYNKFCEDLDAFIESNHCNVAPGPAAYAIMNAVYLIVHSQVESETEADGVLFRMLSDVMQSHRGDNQSTD